MMHYQLTPFSFLDSPKTCAVVFFEGCNLSCDYCYNVDLVRGLNKGSTDWKTADEIVSFIESLEDEGPNGKFTKVDYVIFSGGECTLCQWELMRLMKIAVSVGLDVGIYTNGSVALTKPFKEYLETEPRFSFVSLDYKWTLDDYNKLPNGEELTQNLINNMNFFYGAFMQRQLKQFRINTTCMKGVHDQPEYIEQMKFDVLKNIGHFFRLLTSITVKTREALTEDDTFVWTLTNFYNDNNKIQTLGDISASARLPEVEFNELLARVQ
jgi:pyruvate-formate lyase-activating enzyme